MNGRRPTVSGRFYLWILTRRERLLTAVAVLGSVLGIWWYIGQYRPYADEVFLITGVLQDSNAGENVQGFFAYHSALFAFVTVLLVGLTAFITLRQLRQLGLDRELQVALTILERYLDEPTLTATRLFAYKHGRTLSVIADVLRRGGQIDEHDYKGAREILEVATLHLSQYRETLSSVGALINALNHISVLLRTQMASRTSPSFWHFDFRDPILRAWDRLESLVLFERGLRERQSLDGASFFGSHFQLLGEQMRTDRFRAQLMRELSQRKATVLHYKDMQTLANNTGERDDRWHPIDAVERTTHLVVAGLLLLLLVLAVAYSLDQLTWVMRHRPADYNSTLTSIGTAAAALFTFVLAVVAVAGAIVAVMTLSKIKTQAKAAEDAAIAARTSADAGMMAERAYISISHHPPGITIDELSITHAGEEDFGGWHDVSFRFGITNHGNTPARITDISMNHFVGAPASIPPPPTGGGTGEHLFLVKGDTVSDDRTFQLRHADVTQLGLTQRLWMLGYVDYIDTFGIRRRTGYARFYDPNVNQHVLYTNAQGIFDAERYARRSNLPFVTEPRYNYDRRREPHEGNDWDESQE